MNEIPTQSKKPWYLTPAHLVSWPINWPISKNVHISENIGYYGPIFCMWGKYYDYYIKSLATMGHKPFFKKINLEGIWEP